MEKISKEELVDMNITALCNRMTRIERKLGMPMNLDDLDPLPSTHHSSTKSNVDAPNAIR